MHSGGAQRQRQICLHRRGDTQPLRVTGNGRRPCFVSNLNRNRINGLPQRFKTVTLPL